MVTALESLRQRAPAMVIALVIKILYAAEANGWSIQDKGTLLAAIKLQLAERPTR